VLLGSVVFLVLLAWVMFLLVQFLLYIVFEIVFFVFDICLMFTVQSLPVQSFSVDCTTFEFNLESLDQCTLHFVIIASFQKLVCVWIV
jgi:hypothetical protein